MWNAPTEPITPSGVPRGQPLGVVHYGRKTRRVIANLRGAHICVSFRSENQRRAVPELWGIPGEGRPLRDLTPPGRRFTNHGAGPMRNRPYNRTAKISNARKRRSRNHEGQPQGVVPTEERRAASSPIPQAGRCMRPLRVKYPGGEHRRRRFYFRRGIPSSGTPHNS